MSTIAPLYRVDTRILRPSEYNALNKILKPTQRWQFDCLMFTGMRYAEVKRLQDHLEWFDGHSYINMPNGSSLKEKATFAERTIKLSDFGSKKVANFLEKGVKLPSRQAWDKNIRRWGYLAGLGDEKSNMLSAKTTRKTWESWLMAIYPNQPRLIARCQGHTEKTSMDHYLGLGFYPEEKNAMLEYVEGWL